ncbi:MAG: hypothetical protein PHY56_00055 [Candidatus Omnitrophica bacterium]|nr:hypothetical protein [Candidatus Omnitrophota bacterium]
MFKELLSGGINLVNVKPADSKTPALNAFKMQVLINSQFYKTNVVRKTLDFSTQGIVAGWTPAKIPIVSDSRWLLKRKNLWDTLAPANWFKDQVEYQLKSVKPDFVPYDAFNVYPAPLPTSYDVDEMPWIISEDWLPLEYFKSRDNTYFNIDEKLEEVHFNTQLGYTGNKENQGSLKKVKYWERCGTFKGPGGWREYIIGVGAGNKLVRFERNRTFKQKKPYAFGCNFAIPFNPYGKGEFEPIKNNIYQIDDLQNAVMDNIGNLVHSAYTVLQGSPLAKLTNLMTEAGALFKVNKHEDLRPLQTQNNDIVQSAWRMMDKLQGDSQFTIGTSNWSMGADPERREAVGNVLAIQRVASSKYAKKMYLLIDDPLRRVAEFYGDYNQQFVTEMVDVVYRGPRDKNFKDQIKDIPGSEVLNEEMGIVSINPNELQGEFIYTINLDLMKMEQEVLRQQLQNLFKFLYELQSEDVDLSEFLREILYMYPIRNLDRIIRPPDFAANQIKSVLRTLGQNGYRIIDPSGKEMGSPGSGQNGGPNASATTGQPTATNGAGVRKGVMQNGQIQNTGAGAGAQ